MKSPYTRRRISQRYLDSLTPLPKKAAALKQGILPLHEAHALIKRFHESQALAAAQQLRTLQTRSEGKSPSSFPLFDIPF